MRAPLSWLRDFAPFDLDPVELGRVFDDLGMVVEGIERVGEGLDSVVLGRVIEVAAIEGARVRRTRVDLGPEHGHDVQIVCGGPNVAAGQLVPVAVVGAVLPGDFRIGTRKVFGLESHGMICSAVEVGLGDDAAGIMVLDDDLGAPGDPFAPAMGIEPDVVYDLAIETNRPDASCIAGIARDAAARLGLPFSLPACPALPADLPAPAALPAVAGPELAPRFGVAVLEGATVGPSPGWLARRLTLAGMRPISNLVDISNYVMLELGQPTHPYDLDRLPGGGLGVRVAEPDEVVTTLDGAERRLGGGPSPDVLITDAEGTPVGIAGIMGGASSEVHDGTTRVLLEAAHFDRLTIAKTSKRLGLRSEASARFERGVDPCGIELAIARYAELARQSAGATVTAGAVVESPEHVPVRGPIRVRTARVNGLLGTDLDDDRIARLLAPIGFKSELVEPGIHQVTL
ncbi:MAG: phenylalanine--tRNA ligase subunit beta, partial [Acidimicrobiales bacterium]